MGQKTSVNDIQKSNNIIIEPRNPRQRLYMDSMENCLQTFAIGPAGTGKTFLAAMTAAKMLLRGDVERVILTRPVVGVGGERLGFLPGKAEAKMAPWARPFIDELRQKEVLGAARVDQLMKDKDLEVVPFEHM